MGTPIAPGQEKQCYYSKGNTELATETALTVKRLEPRRKLTKSATRTVIALVGLPARGKSFVSRKMQLYLQWSGVNCRVFNVGKYRREAHAEYLRDHAPLHDVTSGSHRGTKPGACDAEFFDSTNKQAKMIRERAASLALQDMLRWLDEEDYSSGEEDNDRSVADMSRHSTISTFSSASAGAAKLSFRRNERIAIFDATNSTQLRRKWILEECTSPEKRPGNPTGLVFVESICDDQELLEENYRYKISSCPDFDGMTTEEAMTDLRNRVANYEALYEPIADDSMSYIKIFNLSSKLMVNHIYGRMAKELVPALMSWHIGTRPVYLCRPGQTINGLFTDGEDYVNRNRLDPSDPNILDMVARAGRIQKSMLRGDGLGPRGIKFREDLFTFCRDESLNFIRKRKSVRDGIATGTSISGLAPGAEMFGFDGVGGLSGFCHDDIHGHIDPSQDLDGLPESTCFQSEPFPLRIYTSTMPRAADTVNWDDCDFPVNQMSNLNPLDKGDYAGVEDSEDIRKLNPKWFEKFERDPFNTRFPGGESYRDLTNRLKSVLIDVEQQVVPALVVSHVSILQCLMAYFRNTEVEKCMSIDVPMHTVIKFTPVRGGGWSESQHPLLDPNEKSTKADELKPIENVISMSEMSQMTHEMSETSSPVALSWEQNVPRPTFIQKQVS